MKFAADTLKFTGALDVRSGMLDLTEAGELGEYVLKGSGTVKGGSFSGVTVEAGSSLRFFGTSFGSSLTVDFDRTADDPLDSAVLAGGVVIGSFTGTPPAIPAEVRGINTGFGRVRGSVSVVGDKLVARLAKAGTIIFVR